MSPTPLRVLVTYATANGSTEGVATRIADRLRDNGLDTTITNVGLLDGAAGYDAVVAGSAVHNGRWLSPASDFLRQNAQALHEKPLWLFSVSSVGEAGKTRCPAFTRRSGACPSLGAGGCGPGP